MTAEQIVDANLHCSVALGHFFFLVFQRSSEVHTTCRTNHKFAESFVVKVEQNFTLQEVGRHIVHTAHRRFFVGSNEPFKRTVLQGVVFHNCHDGCHSHTIVGTECRILCLYPLAVNPSFDGVGFKIVRRLGSLLRHHIHVALKRHYLAIFHAGRGCLVHDHVSSVVQFCFNALFLCPVEKELLNLFKVSAGTGHLREKVKILPNSLGMEISNF